MDLYIVDKDAKELNDVTYEKEYLLLSKEFKIMLHEIYACMYCQELCNITFIIRGENISKLSIIIRERNKFLEILNSIRRNYNDIELLEQNKKINGYASALVEKLRNGIETTIMETKEQEAIKCCPVCGMQCDPNIPYCMECGAEV